ncbi:MAG: hypothetical protein WAL50_12525, partial [Kineosporiaceae bacterium]
MQGSTRTAGPPADPHPFPDPAQPTATLAGPPAAAGPVPGAVQDPPTAPTEHVRDALGRLVVVDLSARAPGIHAPEPAQVRLLGSASATRPDVERWGD